MNDRIYYVTDLESLQDVFIACITRHDTGHEWYFEVSERRNDSRAFLNFVRSLGPFPQCHMVTYNGLGYDYVLIHYLLTNFPQGFTAMDAFNKSQAIVNTPWNDRFKNTVWPRDWVCRQLDLFKLHGHDNQARSTSLKMLEIGMRMPTVVEFEVDWDAPLGRERIPDLAAYCRYDVHATGLFLDHSIKEIALRDEMTAYTGIDMLNKSQIDMGEAIFINEIEKRSAGSTAKGRNAHLVEQPCPLNEIILPIVEFETPAFNDILQHFRNSTVTTPKGFFKDLTVDAHGMEYAFGAGGIHAAAPTVSVKATNARRVVTLDVTSYYPRLSGLWNLAPQHIGQPFVDVYNDLFAKRYEFKAAGEKMKEQAIKLSLNSVFGKGGSKYSRLSDGVRFMLSITVNGQLLLCMLAEQLVKIPSVQMINVNTDGVTFAIDDEDFHRAEQIKTWWENLTRLNLDFDEWEAIYQRDVNTYMAVEHGSRTVKGKGALEWRHGLETKGNWHKNQSTKIIAKAAEFYLVDGTPIEQTIYDCTDPYDFMQTLKIGRKDRAVMGGALGKYQDGVDAKGKPKMRPIHKGGEEQQRVGRYYIGIQGQQLWKIMAPLPKLPNHYRPQAVLKDVKTCMCNDVYHFDWNNLDRQWYIEQAKELVRSTGTEI